jgi:diacylglycerol O-acyltransferase 1
MNLRLVLENFKKYGVLICLTCNRYRTVDLMLGAGLYALIPCHLFVAYLIELVAAHQAKGAIGRRKRSNVGINSPETQKDRDEFYTTWWWIAFAHTFNAGLGLLITNVVVYCFIYNPGIGSLCELHAIVVSLKTFSYALTNRDLRHAMLHPSSSSSAALPEIYSECPYPTNIYFYDLCYFWWAPTLVYQPVYPRTDHIRWIFVLKRFLEVIGLTVFIWLVVAQYASPLLRNSLDKMAVMDIASITERLMKLSTISLISWLAGFFALFQSFLNLLAELLRFGDRNFYDDWWNSTDLKQYWSTWNKPVYNFMRRHVFSPLVGRGWSQTAASAMVFVFSGVLHELVVGVPTHNILGVAFLGMVVQLPLIQITAPLAKIEGITGKVIGNCIFWISFVLIGQPLAALLYFFAWQAKYGSLART